MRKATCNACQCPSPTWSGPLNACQADSVRRSPSPARCAGTPASSSWTNPTAALGVKETALVLNLVRKLREEGRTVILISHNMADVVALADRVAILKSGTKVIERDVAGLDADTLAHLVMTGRE